MSVHSDLTTSENPHEEAARWRKVAILAVRAAAPVWGGPTWQYVADCWTDADWEALAKDCGVTPPSETTRRAVIEVLRRDYERNG